MMLQDQEKDPKTPDAAADPMPAETGAGAPAYDGPAKPEHFHGRLLDQFQSSLASEGEEAYKRWGLALFHSLSDEDVEAQRATLGVAAKDALDHYNHGCLLAAKQDFKAAAKAFQEALNRDPDLAEAWFNRALALDEAGDAAGARQAYQDYLGKFGDSDDAAEIKQRLTALA